MENQEEKKLPKKSELIEEQKTLVDQYNKQAEALINKEFSVNVGNKFQFNKLCKFVEKEIKADYMTASGIVMLQSNLKQQKPYTNEDDWNGYILLNTQSCKALWKGIQQWEGKGAFDAIDFLRTLQLVGPEVAKAVNSINDEQVSMRGLHTRLDEIDGILDRGEYENDVPDEEAKEVVKEEEEKNDEIQQEVNPQVE